MNTKNVQKILDYPAPKNKKEIQTLCGMAVYYRKYIPRYSLMMQPIYALTKKDVNFEWSKACENAFQQLKKCLTTPPVLAPPDLSSSEPLRVTIAGSSYGTAWVIEQKSMDSKTGKSILKTVCYGSKSISATESRYHSTDLELLALENCLNANRVLLKSKPFMVFTDNRSLVYLVKKDLDKVKGTTARRLLNCKAFDFTIEHIKGSTNHADALSRNPGEDYPEQSILNSDGPYVFHSTCGENLVKSTTEDSISISVTEVKQAQSTDPFARQMIDFIQSHESDNDKIIAQSVDYMLDEELLYNVRHLRNQMQPSIRLYVPKSLVPKVLHAAHTHVLSGHLGIQNTLARIQGRYYWPNMNTDIALYVRTCVKCNETKRGHHKKAPLVPYSVPDGPFRTLHLDTLKLSTPSHGFNYILTIVDAFSKLLVTVPLKSKNALSVSKAIFEAVFQRYGCVAKELTIVSDNAKELTLSYTKALYDLLGIKSITITPFTPNSNGQVEIFNRKILDVLKTYTANNPQTWADNLPLVTMALNSCTNVTGFSAYELLHGTSVTDFMDVSLPKTPENLSKTQEQAFNYWSTELNKVRKLAKYRLQEDKQVQKQVYDRHAQKRDFKIGDLVYLLNTHLPPDS